MKTLTLILCWLAAGAAQAVPPRSQAEINAEKARAIVQKSIAALGGDAYLKILDSRQEGRGFGFSKGEPGGVGIPFVRYYQFPDKERWEYFKGGEWVIIHDGDRGFEKTFRGTREEEPGPLRDYVRRRRYNLDLVLREWVPDPRSAFFFEGTTIANTKEVFQVSIINRENLGVTLYIDTQTYLPLRKSFTYREPVYKELVEESELYDNYRAEQGVMTPHLITRTRNDQIVSQRFLRSVRYNLGVGQAIFMPGPLDYDKTKK
jgi:hypothetical protein